MSTPAPFNLERWIEDNRHLLRPPVGNKMMWNSGFMVMIVGGPNRRADYHVNPGEELFYQVEGDIVLKVQDEGKIVDVPIREGDIFLLPARVPHSPRRPDNTVGLVVEKKREPGQVDGFQWYCEQCGAKLHEEFVHVTNIVTQLPPLFQRFYGDESKRVCKACGARFTDPKKVG